MRITISALHKPARNSVNMLAVFNECLPKSIFFVIAERKIYSSRIPDCCKMEKAASNDELTVLLKSISFLSKGVSSSKRAKRGERPFCAKSRKTVGENNRERAARCVTSIFIFHCIIKIYSSNIEYNLCYTAYVFSKALPLIGSNLRQIFTFS